jgi:predicted phosphodiesterase
VKILTISDTVMPQLENAANLRRRYSDIDLIVSCGDLPVAYIDFIATILGKPLLYVRGNHDEQYTETPPGGINLHNRFFEYKGVSFVGLEGSIKYNRGKIQYTQLEMHRMVVGLAPHLRYRRWRYGHGVDVFVTHSPPAGIHDGEDYPHKGFQSFLNFMRWYRPRYLWHGHVHTWDRRNVVKTQYHDTLVMNINPYMVIDVEPMSSKE